MLIVVMTYHMQFLLLLPLLLILGCYYLCGLWQEETLNALLLEKLPFHYSSRYFVSFPSAGSNLTYHSTKYNIIVILQESHQPLCMFKITQIHVLFLMLPQ